MYCWDRLNCCSVMGCSKLNKTVTAKKLSHSMLLGCSSLKKVPQGTTHRFTYTIIKFIKYNYVFIWTHTQWRKLSMFLVFWTQNTRSIREDFSESSSKSMSCHKVIPTEPHDGSEVIPDCRNAKHTALSATAAQISQKRELPKDTHSSSTISQQKHCHFKEINNNAVFWWASITSTSEGSACHLQLSEHSQSIQIK